jgi:hypothetical protein
MAPIVWRRTRVSTASSREPKTFASRQAVCTVSGIQRWDRIACSSVEAADPVGWSRHARCNAARRIALPPMVLMSFGSAAAASASGNSLALSGGTIPNRSHGLSRRSSPRPVWAGSRVSSDVSRSNHVGNERCSATRDSRWDGPGLAPYPQSKGDRAPWCRTERAKPDSTEIRCGSCRQHTRGASGAVRAELAALADSADGAVLPWKWSTPPSVGGACWRCCSPTEAATQPRRSGASAATAVGQPQVRDQRARRGRSRL